VRLRNDPNLRSALYGLYCALFEARKLSPQDFKDSRLTTIQTAFMGVENVGWRVVGITPEALKRLAAVKFRKQEIPRAICRGHVVNRIATTRQLFAHAKPLSTKRFFDIFLSNDCTVIMLAEQNRSGLPFPRYIAIDNPDAELFPNGGLIGWKHRKKEREFLAELYKDFKKGCCEVVETSVSRNGEGKRAKPRVGAAGKVRRKTIVVR
jgi:hypothetical protein